MHTSRRAASFSALVKCRSFRRSLPSGSFPRSFLQLIVNLRRRSPSVTKGRMLSRTPSFQIRVPPDGLLVQRLPAHVDIVGWLALQDRLELLLELGAAQLPSAPTTLGPHLVCGSSRGAGVDQLPSRRGVQLVVVDQNREAVGTAIPDVPDERTRFWKSTCCSREEAVAQPVVQRLGAVATPSRSLLARRGPEYAVGCCNGQAQAFGCRLARRIQPAGKDAVLVYGWRQAILALLPATGSRRACDRYLQRLLRPAGLPRNSTDQRVENLVWEDRPGYSSRAISPVNNIEECIGRVLLVTLILRSDSPDLFMKLRR